MAALVGCPKSQAIVNKLSDWRWRINNLYEIMSDEGERIPFVMNAAQEDFFDRMHYLNIILKARQLGFSTFISVFLLDVCLFNRGVHCGLVDVTLDDAKSKLSKIKLAYESLPDWLKDALPMVTCNTKEVSLSNGSSITAGTSHRGGTLQYLHISEFGKICAHYPERATEIVTGALNTVAAGQIVFIESTAEGETGKFYDMCQEARSLERMGTKLTPLDYKFHFYNWTWKPEYAIDPAGVTIPKSDADYFDALQSDHNVRLTSGQKAWYSKKLVSQQMFMKREYPSTPDEAFETTVKGSILGDWINACEARGDIGSYPAAPGVPVHTAWDIGRHDATAVVFYQVMVGLVRIVGYYEAAGTELPTHAKAVKEMYRKNDWVRSDESTDVWPHDGRVTEWGTGRSRVESGIEHGLKIKIAPSLSLQDGIQATRATLGLAQIDQAGCANALRVWRNYRWQWVESRGAFDLSAPAKNGAQHGADALRMMSVTWREIIPSLKEQIDPLKELLREKTFDEAINSQLEDLDDDTV